MLYYLNYDVLQNIVLSTPRKNDFASLKTELEMQPMLPPLDCETP
jgi:hypothetical protein